jgi:hypothetical protein
MGEGQVEILSHGLVGGDFIDGAAGDQRVNGADLGLLVLDSLCLGQLLWRDLPLAQQRVGRAPVTGLTLLRREDLVELDGVGGRWGRHRVFEFLRVLLLGGQGRPP